MSEEQLRDSPYWPYVLRETDEEEVGAAIGGPGVGPRLAALRASLEDVSAGMKRVELPGKGIGIVAERELKGVLGVYAGLVTKGNQANDLSNALYQFGAHNGAVSGMCVDAAVLREQGPVWGAGLLNHTCRKPNVKVRVTWIDGRPVVLFEAKRTIQAGEELVWDYNDGRANGFWMSRARCKIEAQEGEPIDLCRCGPAGVCPDGRGMIPIEVRRRLPGPRVGG